MVRSLRTWLKRRLSPVRPIRRSVRLDVRLFEDRLVPNAYTVINTGDTGTGSDTFGDLRYCITQANANPGADTIGFSNNTDNGPTNFYDGANHTITLSAINPLPAITESVVIAGAGADRTIIDADFRYRVFTIDATGTSASGAVQVTLDRLKMVNGRAAAAPDAFGGGISFEDNGDVGSKLTISNSTVSGNAALAATTGGGIGGKAYGGGIFARYVDVTLSHTLIADNVVKGASSYAVPMNDDGSAGEGLGGGLYIDGGVALDVTASQVIRNTAEGGLGRHQGTDPNINGRGGRAYGGGISARDVDAAVSGSVVSENEAKGGETRAFPYQGTTANAFGGGLFADGQSEMDITDCTIADNVLRGSTVTVTSVEAGGVTATAGAGDGGGLFFHSKKGTTGSSTQLFTMSRTEVEGNTAYGGDFTDDYDNNAIIHAGAGVAAGLDVLTTTSGGTVTTQGEVRDSTIASNTAMAGAATVTNNMAGGSSHSSAYGGVAYAGGVAVSRLINSTVYDNEVIGGNATASFENADFGAFAGPAGGGGYGPGYGFPAGAEYGYFFQNLGVTYTIANSTIVGNSAVESTATIDGGNVPLIIEGLAIGGGIDDGFPEIHAAPAYYVTNYSNVKLYSSIVADNHVSEYVTFNEFENADYPIDNGRDIVGGISRGVSQLPLPPTVKGHNLIGRPDASAPNFPQGQFTVGPAPDPNEYGDIAGPDNANNPLIPGFDTTLGQMFGYHGGPTKTFVPAQDGLAADNGEKNGLGTGFPTLTTDQRGGSFERTYNLTSGTAANFSDGTDVGAVERQTEDITAPQVLSIQVNDGTNPQRSEVRSLTVYFTYPVTFTGNPFTLTRQVSGGNVDLAATASPDGMAVVLTFQNFVNPTVIDQVSTQNGGVPSLADGVYQLHIADLAVTGANGQALDGDGNTTAGGAYHSPLDTAGSGAGHVYGLYRLFGDSTGNAVVDLNDLQDFRNTFNVSGPSSVDPRFRDFFDADNNNVVDLTDLQQFRNRFNVSLF